MENQSEFESFSEIDEYIAARQGELMDINHEMMQFSRNSIMEIQGYVRRFQDVANQLYEAHAIGAKMMSDLTGDMIMDEMGLEKVADDEDTSD